MVKSVVSWTIVYDPDMALMLFSGWNLSFVLEHMRNTLVRRYTNL